MNAQTLVEIFAPVYSSLIVFGGWVVAKLGKHDSALAILIQAVNPPGDKSLREMIHEVQLEQARVGKSE